MKVGLFFGSFNPIHNGHLMIANYLAEFTDLDQIWMVVSPHNPHKPAGSLLQDYQRLHLVELAIGSYRKIKASKIEFELPRPSFTVHTMAYLVERFPQNQFSLIMGADNLETLHKWKDYQLLLDQFSIYVYPRPNHDGGNLKNHDKVIWVDAPIIEISSTLIRNAIKSGKDLRFMMPESAYDYLDEMNFYKK